MSLETTEGDEDLNQELSEIEGAAAAANDANVAAAAHLGPDDTGFCCCAARNLAYRVFAIHRTVAP